MTSYVTYHLLSWYSDIIFCRCFFVLNSVAQLLVLIFWSFSWRHFVWLIGHLFSWW